jgi:hypothetical protein
MVKKILGVVLTVGVLFTMSPLSVMAANSPSADNSATETKIESILDSTADPDTVLNTLTTSVSKADLQNAMQTNPDIRKDVKALEDNYAAANNITVSAPSISTEAQKQISGAVSVVGAAFNAKAGESVQLALTVPSTLVNIDTNAYANSVQLDLSLLIGGAAKSNLDVPVSVTMPIPTGVSAQNLVVLHAHDGNAPEALATSVNADGTVTFTVTGFSTFIFANTTETKTSNTETTTQTTDNNTASQGNTVVTSPKTADTDMMRFVLILAAGMGAAAYGMYSFKKVR